MSAEEQAGYSVLDLFAGAGGLTAGFVAEGFRSVGAVESDPAAAASYAANFGAHVYAGEIEDFAAGQVVPQVDVVIGGPPCQGFSNLGLRRADDPRNRLWRAYADVVRRARPFAFVIENVALFEDSAEFRRLRWHCRSRQLLDGYEVRYVGVLNAADFGAPQLRRRAIVIGVRREIATVVEPEPTHGATRGLQPRLTVADRLERIAAAPDGIDLPGDRRFELTLPTGEIASLRGAFRSDETHLGRRPTQLSLDRFRAIPAGGNWRDLPDDLKARCWKERKTHGSGDVMGRLRPDEPSVTIRTEFYKPEKGRYLHPTEDRPITHYEAARLMGFDDTHLWCGSKAAIACQIGNAVPPPLATGVARSVRATLIAAGIERKRGPRVA